MPLTVMKTLLEVCVRKLLIAVVIMQMVCRPIVVGVAGAVPLPLSLCIVDHPRFMALDRGPDSLSTG